MPVTDYYSIAEAALATYIKALGTGFFPASSKDAAGWQVSDDDTVLAKGGEYFAIYRPGSCPVTTIARGIYDYNWEVILDLYVRYVSYKLSWTKFKGYRAALITQLDTNQTLGDCQGVHGVSFRSDERPMYFRFNGADETAKPNFLIQTAQVVIRQRVMYLSGDL